MNCSVIVALLLSLTNLGVFFWRGGVFVAEFRALQREVAAMKSEGSPKYSEHIKLDDYVRANDKEHFRQLDTIVGMIPTMDKRLALIEQKLDTLQRGLDEHKEQTKTAKP